MDKHILIVCQYFYPEQFRINDICSEWVKRGYDVTVLTGIPNYPQGRFYEGYGLFKKRKEFWIIRFPAVANKEEELTLNIPIDELLKIWKENGIDAAIAANNGIEPESTQEEKPFTAKEAIKERSQRLFSSIGPDGLPKPAFPRLKIVDVASMLDQIELDDNQVDKPDDNPTTDNTPDEDSE